MALGAGVALAADMVVWHTSIEMIGAGLATLIANTSVVFVALGAWIVFRERPARTTVIAIPVILLGVTLVSGVGQGDAFGHHEVGQRGRIADLEVHQAGVARGAAVAGGNEDGLDAFRLGQFPGQGVFTAARADYEDFHTLPWDYSSITALV